MSKLKVVLPFRTTMQFHNSYDGGTKYVDYFSRALAKQGVDVTIVTSLLEDKNIKKRKHEGVKYVFLPPRIRKDRLINLNAPYKLLFSKNLKAYLEKNDFDILHSFGMLAFSYLHKSKKRRKPVITQPWGLEPFYGSDSLSQKGLKKLYVKTAIQHPWLYCLKNSDKIASEGDFQLGDITQLGIKKEKVFPLLIGIDTERIEQFRKNYKDKKSELGINKDDLVILSVNQIAPDKGIDDIINSFALLKRKVKHAKLIMVGSGTLEKMMYDLIKKHGLENDIFHLKNISEEDLYACYFSSDIYVSAAIQKDWIMGIQEAMACGMPVVSSAQPFLVEDGKNGYVVGMKNPEGIAEGILKIYNGGQTKKMSSESKALAKKYEWDNIAKSAIKMYGELLKNKDKF